MYSKTYALGQTASTWAQQVTAVDYKAFSLRVCRIVGKCTYVWTNQRPVSLSPTLSPPYKPYWYTSFLQRASMLRCRGQSLALRRLAGVLDPTTLWGCRRIGTGAMVAAPKSAVGGAHAGYMARERRWEHQRPDGARRSRKAYRGVHDFTVVAEPVFPSADGSQTPRGR